VPDLAAIAAKLLKHPPEESALWQEFLLEGLFQGGSLAREDSQRGLIYSDLLASLMTRKQGKGRRS
jgi:hypothetical protein